MCRQFSEIVVIVGGVSVFVFGFVVGWGGFEEGSWVVSWGGFVGWGGVVGWGTVSQDNGSQAKSDENLKNE